MESKIDKTRAVSTYQQYLPAILQKDVLIGQFLLAFEKILSGKDATDGQAQIILEDTPNPPGLEEIIDNIHLYFIPEKAPKEFLPWLAGWVALSLRDDWSDELKKEFIKQVVKHYPKRGTKEGLEEVLEVYLEKTLNEKPCFEVIDEFNDFPNYFQVKITLEKNNTEKYWRVAKIAKAIIDWEKPAQTFYSLKIPLITMRIPLNQDDKEKLIICKQLKDGTKQGTTILGTTHSMS